MKFRILMRTLARRAWRQACEAHIERCELLFGSLDAQACGIAPARRGGTGKARGRAVRG
jgi:hypothetical protein